MNYDPQRETAVGDLTSDEKGSGARDNAGKVPVELLPWKCVASLIQPANQQEAYVKKAMELLGAFQSGDDYALSHLLRAVSLACGMSMRQLLEEAAYVLEHGIAKYKAWNWAKGMRWSVCIGCIGRHLQKMQANPRALDDGPNGSGRMHAGCVAANVLFLLEYMTSYRQGDDRPKELASFPPSQPA
jgi:hypothetical protein